MKKFKVLIKGRGVIEELCFYTSDLKRLTNHLEFTDEKGKYQLFSFEEVIGVNQIE